MRPDLSAWQGQLAALAQFDPPVRGWSGVLAARQQRVARASLRWPSIAAAAVLALAACLGWWLQSAQRALATAPKRAEPAGLIAAEARADNERLEWMLASLPERRAMSGRTAFTLAELEDRLAFLDDRLSRVALEPNAPEHAEQLWRERVKVMNSLVHVRYADTIGTN